MNAYPCPCWGLPDLKVVWSVHVSFKTDVIHKTSSILDCFGSASTQLTTSTNVFVPFIQACQEVILLMWLWCAKIKQDTKWYLFASGHKASLRQLMNYSINISNKDKHTAATIALSANPCPRDKTACFTNCTKYIAGQKKKNENLVKCLRW